VYEIEIMQVNEMSREEKIYDMKEDEYSRQEIFFQVEENDERVSEVHVVENML
jgi:hypothetical protein